MHLTSRRRVIWVQHANKKCSDWRLLWLSQRLAPGAEAPLPYASLHRGHATPSPAAFQARREGFLGLREVPSFCCRSFQYLPNLSLSLLPPEPRCPPDTRAQGRSAPGAPPSRRLIHMSGCSGLPLLSGFIRAGSAPPSPPNPGDEHRKRLNRTCPLTLGTRPSATFSNPPPSKPNKNGKQETLVF